jgi:hypothetical protein
VHILLYIRKNNDFSTQDEHLGLLGLRSADQPPQSPLRDTLYIQRSETMQYTLILTENAEGGIQVTSPALPACRVEAATRDDAIRLAREATAQLMSRSEVV